MMNIGTTFFCAAAAALVFVGCGEPTITEKPRISLHEININGDVVRKESIDGGEVQYYLNGKKVSKEQVPSKFFRPFGADGGNAETLVESSVADSGEN